MVLQERHGVYRIPKIGVCANMTVGTIRSFIRNMVKLGLIVNFTL
jgi:hypothetical protein